MSDPGVFPKFHGSYSVRLLQKVIGKSERVGESSSKRHLTFTKASWRIQKILLWVGVGRGGGPNKKNLPWERYG